MNSRYVAPTGPGGFDAVVIPDGRRGLWMRATDTSIELRAGREGGDSEFTIRAGDTVDAKTIANLEDVLSTLRYAGEVAVEGPPWNALRFEREEHVRRVLGAGPDETTEEAATRIMSGRKLLT